MVVLAGERPVFACSGLLQLADEHGVAIVAPSFGAGNWFLEGGMEPVDLALTLIEDHPQSVQRRTRARCRLYQRGGGSRDWLLE